MRPDPRIEPGDGVEGAEVVRDGQVLHRRGAAENRLEERLRTVDGGRLEEVGQGCTGQRGRILRQSLETYSIS